MGKKNIFMALLLLTAWPLAQKASAWEWQFAVGPWTLEPWTSPVTRAAESMVEDEARHLLAPLLSEFTIFSFSPQIELNSHGWSATACCWRRLKGNRFALGVSASYLDFSLPFTLNDKHDIYFQGMPLAHIDISGQGKIDLRTIMLAAQGRWRVFQAGRTSVYTGLGLTLLSFNGRMQLPLDAMVQSFMGSFELHKNEDKSLAELRAENDSIPAWILSPALTVSLHYRLGAKSRLFIEINLSQGTFLAAGMSFGR
jgi:hypothetical protein